jgi:hypothetical protein
MNWTITKDMKKILVLLFVILFLISCKEKMETQRDTVNPEYYFFPYMKDVQRFIDTIKYEKKEGRTINYITEKKGQILYVNEYAVKANSSIVDSNKKTIYSHTVIQLTGDPSPSSEVQMAYITFDEKSNLRKPDYRDKTLRIWMSYNELESVLYILNNRGLQLHIWYGEFDGGHIFSELYSYTKTE